MMTYKTIEEWIERNPNHIGAIPIEVCRQIWGTKDAQNMASKSTYKEQLETKDEPFEYWNAVEGWVKLDEVREHFESASCGTIYKNGGEGRVPLYITPQRTWVGLTDVEIDQGLLRTNHALQTAGAWREGVEWATEQLKEKNT
jgi:hypothetical protein